MVPVLEAFLATICELATDLFAKKGLCYQDTLSVTMQVAMMLKPSWGEPGDFSIRPNKRLTSSDIEDD